MYRTNGVSVETLNDKPETAPILRAVIVPTFNERDNVGPLYDKICVVMPASRWEVIFVDDDSKDGTADAVRQLAEQHINVRLIRRFGRRGLSSAAIEGMMATTAPVVAVIDADMQHDEKILPDLFAAVEAGDDLALGTRYAGDGSIGDWDKSRARISRWATAVASRLNHNPVSDPMSGFLAVRQSLMVELMPRLSIIGFKLLLDILMSSPRKLQITEVNYHFRNRIAGESKLDSAVSLEFLMLLLEKKIGRWIPARFVMFVLVGSMGLILHLLLLRLFLAVNVSFPVAQAVAVGITIATNFILNNALTYRDRRLKGWAMAQGLASFYAICGVGAMANVGVATVVYSNNERWWLAGIAGAAISAVWNYAASSFLTWRNK